MFLASLMSGHSLGEAAALGVGQFGSVRSCRQHRRDDRGGRFHLRYIWKARMVIEQPLRQEERPRSLGFADRQGQSPGADDRLAVTRPARDARLRWRCRSGDPVF